MREGLATARPGFLLLALLCLCVWPAVRADAQEAPGADAPGPQAGTTRKIDEYGKIGHCDETARLDNFAIELQNEPGSNGYLLVYFGKDDLPAWTNGILNRAAHYLVNSRGIEPGRVKVVNAGYREKRATELWVVPENDPAPQPSDTVDFQLDRTKTYKWNEQRFDIAFTPDDTGPEAPAGEEAADSEGAADESADSGEAEASAGEGEGEAEESEEEKWEKEAAKYEVSVVARGVLEDETGPEGAGAEAAGGPAEDAETPAGPEEPPAVGEIEISLWWRVEALADELKAAPDARLSLVYYWGVKTATREMVKQLVEQALAKTEEQLGVKRDRVVVIDGGRSADPGIELWVVPPGGELPKPRPGQERNFGFYSAPGDE